MKKFSVLVIIGLAALLLLTVHGVALGESMPGMDHDMEPGQSMEGMDQEKPQDSPPEIPAGRGSDDYKPVETPADDSTMAVIAASIFALPVGVWFVRRSMKKANKTSK